MGLQVEAAYGINILKYTETLSSTSSASSPFESLRGLGYWFFYGGLRTRRATGPRRRWPTPSSLALIGVSFLVPALAFAAAAAVRWRQRAYFIVLLVVGMVLAVGPFPYYQADGVGAILKAFMSDTTAGLALRSTDRAVPLVLLGPGRPARGRGHGRRRALPAGRPRRAGMGIVAIAVASTPMWTGGTVVDQNIQPARPPAYVLPSRRPPERHPSRHPGVGTARGQFRRVPVG